MKNNKGNISIIILVVVAFAILGGGYYYYSSQKNNIEFDDPRKQQLFEETKKQIEELDFDEAELKATNAKSKSLISSLRLGLELFYDKNNGYPKLSVGCYPVSVLAQKANDPMITDNVNEMLDHEKENPITSFFVGVRQDGEAHVLGVNLLGKEEGRVIPPSQNPSDILGCNCTEKFCYYTEN